MPNMSYCMFENTSKDMQDIIDKMYEDDFDPDKLSKTERRAFDALWDQCETISERLSELDDMLQERADAEWEESDEAREEEYQMHKAIVGTERANEDFGIDSTEDDFSRNTFTRKD
ncbi:hypothetical protein pEaSNUABM50_00346 [Erwinia phage pEa_SNUABM_50]|uniref:Uncharacterized protein n=3 Tax=Eneladusvirus BF TaxID=2560751 RepID=A0A7L8ZPF8_9CAUD|nr:hypothetical protein FDH34_gp350 [Serratia phage BF]AQW88875.1 hypothetical protein BF_0350 [Serratia phage BF]QOI71831.1 hypothetical protein pEaSNUABM47_00347 [Erwinia phage pEa_SNUABM_47]QOI72370.1 hypothetical protein pEaSNUABM50_00346 [Erwinia phage pEa_SNUABM_50]